MLAAKKVDFRQAHQVNPVGRKEVFQVGSQINLLMNRQPDRGFRQNADVQIGALEIENPVAA